MRRTRRFLRRTVGAVRLLARDERLPRPLRGLIGLGLLPVPGPFDELLLLVLAAVLVAFYREPLQQAWKTAGPAA